MASLKRAALLAGALVVVAAPQGASAAGDQRQYEMVSPAQKNSSVSGPAVNFDVQVTRGGEVFYPANTPLSSSQTGLFDYYRADRGLEGWATTPLLAPYLGRVASGWVGSGNIGPVTASGDEVLVDTAQPLNPADVDGDGGPAGADSLPMDLYMLHRDGTVSFITKNVVDPHKTTGYERYTLSRDGSHVLFEAFAPLLPADEARTGARGLYVWHDGTLQLVATDSTGALLSTGTVTYGPNTSAEKGPNPISTDGSRIFFTIDDVHLYVWDHGAVRRVAPAVPDDHSETFQGATPDGGTAFFLTNVPLTSDDHDASVDLYAFSTASGQLRRISAGATSPSGAGVVDRGVRTSDDGKIVYFVATGSIGGAPKPPAGAENLYVSDHGQVRRVATVTAGDLHRGSACVGTTTRDNWYATPDGQHLVFASHAPATSDDLDSRVDVFEYSLNNGRVDRASLGDDGGNADLDVTLGADGDDCGASTTNPPLVISSDGRYVVFQTSEGLSDRDGNGANDVYAHDLTSGTTELISGGRDSHTSSFLGMTPLGQDIFFATYERLVPQDRDSFKDIYDARVGGGFPVADPAPSCRADDCQVVPPNTATGTGAPASATSSGEADQEGLAVGGRVTIGRPTAAALRRAARTGRLTLSVRVGGRGTLRVRAKAHLTRGARVTIASRSLPVDRAGRVSVTLSLSAASRHALVRRGRLALVLEAALPPGPTARVGCTLRRTPATAAARSSVSTHTAN